MDNENIAAPAIVGQRGPPEHERREQIIAAAQSHFRLYGYNKTTVADLAKAIGLSTAYIYKFFDSKKAIGEAVCGMCLGHIQASLRASAGEGGSASSCLRNSFVALAAETSRLLFSDRKLADIVTAAIEQRWGAVHAHEIALTQIIHGLVIRGRESGEFERKTPIDETCRAILQTMRPFGHPVLLEQNLAHANEDALAVANLVLRSLSP